MGASMPPLIFHINQNSIRPVCGNIAQCKSLMWSSFAVYLIPPSVFLAITPDFSFLTQAYRIRPADANFFSDCPLHPNDGLWGDAAIRPMAAVACPFNSKTFDELNDSHRARWATN
jgi:hypothetical protein